MYELLLKLSKPAPRYTSYPTAPMWEELLPEEYKQSLTRFKEKNDPISLYVHIPFCHSMCLYCGCSVILNRKEENEQRYVDYLIKEMDLVTQMMGKKKVHQLHFGGGTPTKLSPPLFSKLFHSIQDHFEIDFSKEIAIEIDPRTVYQDKGEKLKLLKKLGFNRVSFGVQDTNPKVQEAIKRNQPIEVTKWTFEYAKELGFEGINCDLIYGLPFQTGETFKETVSHILEMKPDRIALFSYAKVPWLKPHQKAIKETTLPPLEEKFRIYANARKAFIHAGYLAIGMDHFTLKEDEMATAYLAGKLARNFQGYTVRYAEDLIGLGVTSIGFHQNLYVQNVKDLNQYYALLDRGILPVHRGRRQTEEDILRKWVIHTLMCRFELNKSEFKTLFGIPFDFHFKEEIPLLDPHEQDGLLIHTKEKIQVTPQGELFIRNIASVFDAYLKSKPAQFSNTI